MDAKVDVYRRRGEQFADAMRLCRGDSAYASATALLAIHSSILYNDAVSAKLTGRKHRGENHKTAIAETRKACNRVGLAVGGMLHLQRLIASKSQVSYGSNRVEEELVEVLCLSAERFEAWALPIIKS